MSKTCEPEPQDVHGPTSRFKTKLSKNMSREVKDLLEYSRSLVSLLASSNKLNLNTVYAVNAVDEENKDKDESNFHPVLNFCDDGVLGDEARDKLKS